MIRGASLRSRVKGNFQARFWNSGGRGDSPTDCSGMCEILVAHRSRSAQGRVHFMTTFVLVVMQDWDGMDLQDAKTPNARISETV